MTMTDANKRVEQRSPYLEGMYAPVQGEVRADLEVIAGEIPADLRGVFTRNGSNPRFEPEGRYHWFDGDGMVHAVHFDDTGAHYANRYVRTRALATEEAAGEALWTGILEPPDFSKFPDVFKDTANTDLVFFNGELLALWWLGGDAYRVSLPDLETLGTEDFGGTLRTHIAAHPKVDPVTGELLFIDYDPVPPFLTLGVVSADGKVVRSQTVDVGGPRLQHDIAFSDDWIVVFDFPFMWEQADGRSRLAFHRDRPSRFGLVARDGDTSAPVADVRWFETDPCFMYHVCGAWQEDGVVKLVGCEIADPLASDPGNSPDLPAAPQIAMLRLEPFLTEWTFHLADGTITKRRLDDQMAEFPRIDVRRIGQPFRYSYLMRFAERSELAFDGVIRHDRLTGETISHAWPEGWYGCETPFCPKQGATDEAEGYLVAFVAEEATGRSEVHVLDAARLEDGPVCRLAVPARVPAGYHSWWVPAEDLTSP